MNNLVKWNATTSGLLKRGLIPQGLDFSDFSGGFDNESERNWIVSNYLGLPSTMSTHGLEAYVPAVVEEVLPVIRNITTGAMQSRFTIMEEVAIIDGANSFSKVLLARLMNARYAGLDQTETQEGVAYIVNFLDSVGAIDQGVTPSVRIDKLLEDGLPIEEFLGELQQTQ